MADGKNGRKKDSLNPMSRHYCMNIGVLRILAMTQSFKKGILSNGVGTNVHLNYLDRIYAKGLVKHINIQEGG